MSIDLISHHPPKLIRLLLEDHGLDGIQVHTICPGGVATDLAPDVPEESLIEPKAIANAVIFLLTQPPNTAIDNISIRRALSSPWK